MEWKDRIKSRRIDLGLTLEKVAQAVGVSAATISRWERGEISSLSADKVSCLAEVLQVTPDYLMGWEIPAQEGQLNNVYFNFAREAQENNIDPDDIRIAIDMIRKLKRKHSQK